MAKTTDDSIIRDSEVVTGTTLLDELSLALHTFSSSWIGLLQGSALLQLVWRRAELPSVSRGSINVVIWTDDLRLHTNYLLWSL